VILYGIRYVEFISTRSAGWGKTSTVCGKAQFTALRYFCIDGTDHESHEAQAFLIRRYIAWRNRNARDETLRELIKGANVA
jgi:hypothetical protein